MAFARVAFDMRQYDIVTPVSTTQSARVKVVSVPSQWIDVFLVDIRVHPLITDKAQTLLPLILSTAGSRA